MPRRYLCLQTADMGKKFELVNGWVIQREFPVTASTLLFSSMKWDAVSLVSAFNIADDNGTPTYFICLAGNDTELQFEYAHTEKQEFESDLAAFRQLIGT